jgi:hypothetical protein
MVSGAHHESKHAQLFRRCDGRAANQTQPIDEFVSRLCRVQQPLGLFGTRYGKQSGVEHSDLETAAQRDTSHHAG